MSVNVTFINASLSGKHSVTGKTFEHMKKGMEAAGAKTETFVLKKMDFNHCDGELSCWKENPGVCKHNDGYISINSDDMDLVIIGYGICVNNIPSILQKFYERGIKDINPKIKLDKNGNAYHPMPARPPFVVLANAGFPGSDAFVATDFHSRRLAQLQKRDLGAIIRRPQAPLLGLSVEILKSKMLREIKGAPLPEQQKKHIEQKITQQMEGLKIKQAEYFSRIEEAGKEMIERFKEVRLSEEFREMTKKDTEDQRSESPDVFTDKLLSKDTLDKLSEPFMDNAAYCERHNANVDKWNAVRI